MIISKHKLKNFLAERVTNNLVQTSDEELYNYVRYDGIKGFEQYNDRELFSLLQETIPEFELVKIDKTDNNHYYLVVKSKHKSNADDIMIDIKRLIQMKMLA